MSPLNLRSLAVAFTCVSLAAHAIAAPATTPVNNLLKREISWDSSCTRKITNDPQGRAYKDKAGIAFSDAATIANNIGTALPSDGSLIQGNAAFTHYFDQTDLTQAQQMWQTIYNNNIPSTEDGGYTITVKCGSDQDRTCSPSTLASTNARPGSAGQIVLCDRFFIDWGSLPTQQTQNNLASKPFTSRRGGWCQDGENFPFFEIAGLTVLHEMTHLDTIGQVAGLSARPDSDENG